MANALPTELSPQPLNILKGGEEEKEKEKEEEEKAVEEEGGRERKLSNSSPCLSSQQIGWGWRIPGQSGLCSKTLSERTERKGTRGSYSSTDSSQAWVPTKFLPLEGRC